MRVEFPPVPTGCVLPYAGPTTKIPAGWLLCNGAAVSRSLYATLFGVLGITHGQGDGTTTFNVPDYRGRFLRGVDGGATRDPDRGTRTAMATGGNTGDNVGSVQDHMLQDHNVNVPRSPYGSGGDWASTGYLAHAWYNNGVNVGTLALGPASGNHGSETRPVNAGVHYIIKT